MVKVYVCAWIVYFEGENKWCEYMSDYWSGNSNFENKLSFLLGCGGLPIFGRNVNLNVACAKYMHI
jgi:hypothetical protein